MIVFRSDLIQSFQFDRIDPFILRPLLFPKHRYHEGKTSQEKEEARYCGSDALPLDGRRQVKYGGEDEHDPSNQIVFFMSRQRRPTNELTVNHRRG